MNILTDDEITNIFDNHDQSFRQFARAIEAAIMAKFEVVAMVKPPMHGTLSAEITKHMPQFTQLYALKEKK